MRRNTLARTVVVCVTLFLSGAAPALAQTAIEERLGRIEKSLQKLDALERKFESQDQKLEELDRDSWELQVRLYAVVAALLGIAALAGLSRLLSSQETTKREQNISHMLGLIARGEAAAQQRAAELHNVMLKEGGNTLRLVNDTLSLAKSASEGAIKAALTRVTARANNLEQEVAAFLRPYANRDNRDFVNDINKRDQLRKLVYKLKDLEQVNNTLEEPVKFGPNTHFLKALEYYIEKQFDETIETLQVLVDRADVPVPVDLRIRAQYWIAYEQNNIGEFSKAELSFESAISTAEQSKAAIERILELKRLHIESMLFNAETYKAASLINNINELVEQCVPLDDRTIKDNLARTKANVLYASAMDAYDGGKGNAAEAMAYMREAKKLLEPLACLDRPEQGKDFALCDWGLISILLGEDEEQAKALLYKEVRNWARNQVANRMGTHHKVAFTVLQLLVYEACNPKDPRIAPLDILITRLIGEIHNRVMIYSHLQKRNVSREVLLGEIRAVVNHGLPYITQKPS